MTYRRNPRSSWTIPLTLLSWLVGGGLASPSLVNHWAHVLGGYSYTHDPQGLRTSLSINPQAPALSQVYGYDSAWRPWTISSLAGTFTYGYGSSPGSIVRTIGLPNAAYVTNHFDGLNRRDYTALVNYWGHVLDGYSYTHDPQGLRTNIARDFGLTTNSVTVGYDAIGQISSWAAAELNGSARLNERLGWAYDAAHNLRFRTNGALVQTFGCDAANQITNISRAGTLTVSGETPAPATNITVNDAAAELYADLTFEVNGNQRRGMSHPFESQHRRSFALLTCPVTMERSFHLSFRTSQREGHPHPALSRSTSCNFPLDLSPKIYRPTELETRPQRLCP